MKRIIIFAILFLYFQLSSVFCQTINADKILDEKLMYHPIRINATDSTILPWHSSNLGESYNLVIEKVWNFWDTMRIDMNGLPYYMNHQVWKSEVNDTRGVAGSQFEMALNSWRLYYQYSGNERQKENAKFIADYYISHSLSPANAAWSNLPYPYNTLSYSGVYDGDMVIGKNYTQPDKAGAFGNELISLYKFVGTSSHGQTPTERYLQTAINIANTLAKHTAEGDYNHSPMPFKVNALIGKKGKITDINGVRKDVELSSYTTNWSGTMELFLSLIEMKKGNTDEYKKAFDTLLAWMKKYPLQNNHWGPFFEDIVGNSDTQINAVTFAQFMMNHPQYFPNWKSEVKGIFSWVYDKLGNKEWAKFGVTVVNEQTAYTIPGNSHSARQAAAELQYAALTGDSSFVDKAVLKLNWATYMVDDDGKNRYPQDGIWLSDGYGDYVRHYLRAMAARPELVPDDANHILSSTSVVQKVYYHNRFVSDDKLEPAIKKPKNTLILYRTYDQKSTETIRMTEKPSAVLVNKISIAENNIQDGDSWNWKSLDNGGLLTINHLSGNEIVVVGK